MSYSNCDTTLVGGQRLSPEHHLSLRAAGGYNLLLLLFIVSSAHWLWLLLLCPKSSLIRTLAVIGRATAVLGRDEIPSWQRFLLLLLLLYIWPGDPAPENQHAHQSDSGPRRENTRSKRTSVPDISAPCACCAYTYWPTVGHFPVQVLANSVFENTACVVFAQFITLNRWTSHEKFN